MTLTRRSFVTAALSSPLLAGARTVVTQGTPEQCSAAEKGPVPEPVNWHRNYDPAIMQDRVFQGYRARATALTADTFYEYRTGARSLLNVLKKDNLFVDVVAQVTNCDTWHTVSYEVSPVPAAQDKTVKAVTGSLSTFKSAVAGKPYPEKVRAAIEVVAQSFRDIEYKLHTDVLGVPKTAMSLIADKIGDCKDFALSRAMLATALGVKPDHVMVVIYAPKDPYSKIAGHANVAILDPAINEWVIIDGTGRGGPENALGPVMVYANDSRITAPNFETRVPVMGISKTGVFQFNSISNVRRDRSGISYDVASPEAHHSQKTPYHFVLPPVPVKTVSTPGTPAP